MKIDYSIWSRYVVIHSKRGLLITDQEHACLEEACIPKLHSCLWSVRFPSAWKGQVESSGPTAGLSRLVSRDERCLL